MEKNTDFKFEDIYNPITNYLNDFNQENPNSHPKRSNNNSSEDANCCDYLIHYLCYFFIHE